MVLRLAAAPMALIIAKLGICPAQGMKASVVPREIAVQLMDLVYQLVAVAVEVDLEEVLEVVVELEAVEVEEALVVVEAEEALEVVEEKASAPAPAQAEKLAVCQPQAQIPVADREVTQLWLAAIRQGSVPLPRLHPLSSR